jgi:predicted Zn-dependent protease
MAADASAIATKLIKLVKQKEAAAEAQVVVRLGREQNTRFAAGEITTAGDTDIVDVVLTVAIGTRHATATSTETNPDRLEPLAARALAMAKLAPEDPEWVPVLGPQKYAASANEYDEATATLGNEQRAKAAREIIRLADEKQVIPAGFYLTRDVKRFLANSDGAHSRRHGLGLGGRGGDARFLDRCGSDRAFGDRQVHPVAITEGATRWRVHRRARADGRR